MLTNVLFGNRTRTNLEYMVDFPSFPTAHERADLELFGRHGGKQYRTEG